jgi:putative transposase
VKPVSYYRFKKRTDDDDKTEREASESNPTRWTEAEAVREIFWRHSRRYGSRRIHAELLAKGAKVGRHKVRRMLREQGLRPIQPKSFVPRTTDSRHLLGYSPNLLLKEKLPPKKPKQVIVGDITYLPLADGGFAYLATWIDLFSRKILGWAIRDNMEERLIIEAMEMVVRRYAPLKEAIVHSDRGGQYAGRSFRRLLEKYRIRQSMSRAGETYDNAYAESLFSRYKAELLEDGVFPDLEVARIETFNYVEGYYNRLRRHSALGYLSPEEFERKYVEERDRELGRKLEENPPKGIPAKQHLCNKL